MSIYDDTISLLENGNGYSIKDIYKELGINGENNKEQRREAKRAFDDFMSAPLRYSVKKGNTKISRRSKALEKLVREKHLDFDEKNNIVRLTKKNAKIINGLIKSDPDYVPFAKYLYLFFGKGKVKRNTDNALFTVIREIDRDNSTNVWRYKRNRDNFNRVIKYITDPKNEFFKKLRDGNTDLPDLLAREDVGGSAVKSLSSKICKYLSEYMFNADSYYINDSFIRHALLFYLDYYKTDHKLKNGKQIDSTNGKNGVDSLSYDDLYGLLNKLKDAAGRIEGQNIKKSELDHIIWYCYKSFKI